jgi:hypothetical protein
MRQHIKKAHDSLRREVLCNILIVFGIPMKLVRLRGNIDAINKNTESLNDASKEVGLEVNIDLSICLCLITRMQTKIEI